MNDFIKELEAYFLDSTKEKLIDDWKRLSAEHCFGPDVSSYIQETLDTYAHSEGIVSRISCEDVFKDSYDEHTQLGLTA